MVLLFLVIGFLDDRRQGWLSGIGRCLHHREQYADHRDAVGDAVVEPHDQCRAAQRGIDQVHLPERAPRIERHRGEIGDEALQLDLARLAREPFAMQMVVQIEVGIVLPEISGAILHGELAEPTVAEHAALDRGAQALVVDIALEKHDPDDLHQVARAIHAQPGGIDV